MSLTLPALHVMGDITVNKGSVLGVRTIDDFELVFFPTGSRTVYENDRGEFLLDRPGIVFTCPGEPHRYRFDPLVPTRHLYVHFEYAAFRETLCGQDDSRGECQDWSVIAGGSLVPSLLKQMLKIVHVKPHGWQRRGAILLLSVLEEWQAIDEDDSRSSMNLPSRHWIIWNNIFITRLPLKRLPAVPAGLMSTLPVCLSAGLESLPRRLCWNAVYGERNSY